MYYKKKKQKRILVTPSSSRLVVRRIWVGWGVIRLGLLAWALRYVMLQTESGVVVFACADDTTSDWLQAYPPGLSATRRDKGVDASSPLPLSCVVVIVVFFCCKHGI